MWSFMRWSLVRRLLIPSLKVCKMQFDLKIRASLVNRTAYTLLRNYHELKARSCKRLRTKRFVNNIASVANLSWGYIYKNCASLLPLLMWEYLCYKEIFIFLSWLKCVGKSNQSVFTPFSAGKITSQHIRICFQWPRLRRPIRFWWMAVPVVWYWLITYSLMTVLTRWSSGPQMAVVWRYVFTLAATLEFVNPWNFTRFVWEKHSPNQQNIYM